MPGDRNSILVCSHSHCVSFTFAWGYSRVGYYCSIFAFYVQCLTIAGVSQPSFNVAGEVRISQEPQSYKVLLR